MFLKKEVQVKISRGVDIAVEMNFGRLGHFITKGQNRIICFRHIVNHINHCLHMEMSNTSTTFSSKSSF
jgi:hypothetical protein